MIYLWFCEKLIETISVINIFILFITKYYIPYFNLKLIGIEIKHPLSYFFVSWPESCFLIASIAASSSPVLGIPFIMIVSFTLPFLSINA